MGLFDKIFKAAAPSAFEYRPSNEYEAWVAILYACMAVDGDVADAEIDKMCELLVLKAAFQGKPITEYYRASLNAHKKIGSQGIIDSSAELISEENKPTLLALVMEMLLADGLLEEKEQEIAEYITSKLAIEEVLAQQIIEVILIKNKGNLILS